MKKILFVITILISLASCRKKDNTPAPATPVKLIDKIEIKIKNLSAGMIENKSISFEYNSKKEITKVAMFNENNLHYSYTYVYQNNVPVSSMYNFPGGGDPVYEVKYGYSNGILSSYNDTYYSSTVVFTYNEQFKQFTNSQNGSRFILDDNYDVSIKTISALNNEYAYSFDISKKGPLFNVVNKKWIPAILFGAFTNEITNTLTTYPVIAVFDDNIAQTNPCTNTYDTDGFVTKSIFTVDNGNLEYEINYIYKSL